MKTNKLCLLVALALSAPAYASYKCVDEKGRTHVGDTPPPGCANVVMQQLSKTGQVIRTIQPSMTEEQVKAKLEADEKARIAEKAAAEQKRKDSALLATFANEKEFDVARDRNIEPLKQRIAQSEQRSKEIDKRMKQVKEEMEFYTAGKKKGSKEKDQAAPMKAEIERLEDEKKHLAKSVSDANKEIGEIRTKFDTDKQRWVAIKKGGSKAPEAAAAAAPAPAPADSKSADAKATKK